MYATYIIYRLHRLFTHIACTKVIPGPPTTPTSTILRKSWFSQHIYEWGPPEGTVIGGIEGYYLHSTDSCGVCDAGLVSNDTFNATCTEWLALGQICCFEVRTVTADCSLMSEPTTTCIAFDSKLNRFHQAAYLAHLCVYPVQTHHQQILVRQ